MRRRVLVMLLSMAFLLGTFVPALAADEPEVDGIYGLTVTDASVSIQPLDATGAVVAASGTYDGSDFYPEAVKLKVTVTGVTDSYSLILAQNSSGIPTESNLVYIDQDSASEGTISFTVYPSELKSDTTYYIYLSGNSTGNNQVATFRYYAAYLLGDADMSGSISSNDALYVLQAVAHLRTLTGNAVQAADADKSGSISSNDALYILQAVAHLRTLS